VHLSLASAVHGIPQKSGIYNQAAVVSHYSALQHPKNQHSVWPLVASEGAR